MREPSGKLTNACLLTLFFFYVETIIVNLFIVPTRDVNLTVKYNLVK
jgi:hypothetical protein